MTDNQLVDIRSAGEFQQAHLPGSISLNRKNFNKYAHDLLNQSQAITLIYDDETADDLSSILTIDSFTWASDHIHLNQVSEDLKPFNLISAADFLKLEDPFILLDLRQPEEITRPAPKRNLINIPLTDLAHSLDQLEKSTHIYTLCGSGNRGTTAASYLNTLGYSATVIKGGIVAINKVIDQ